MNSGRGGVGFIGMGWLDFGAGVWGTAQRGH